MLCRGDSIRLRERLLESRYCLNRVALLLASVVIISALWTADSLLLMMYVEIPATKDTYQVRCEQQG